MVRKPPLPDDESLPEAVGAWTHAPESNRNGHVWTNEDEQVSVGVFSSCFSEEVRVTVFDDRVDGFCNNVEPVRQSYSDTDKTKAEATAWAVERAVEWMKRHSPERWSHPDVEEAVFDPPVGYVLERYYIEQRQQIVCYRREDEASAVSLSGRVPDTDPSIQTRDYLYVESWRGSGNTTVSVAPYLRAEDKNKHEVVETPEECGLAVALKLAREHVREQTDQDAPTRPAAGQSDIGVWSD